MVKSVATTDLKSVAFVRPGSSPGAGTILWPIRQCKIGGLPGGPSYNHFIHDPIKLEKIILAIIDLKIKNKTLWCHFWWEMEKKMPGHGFIGTGELQNVVRFRRGIRKTGLAQKPQNSKMDSRNTDIDFWYFDNCGANLPVNERSH